MSVDEKERTSEKVAWIAAEAESIAHGFWSVFPNQDLPSFLRFMEMAWQRRIEESKWWKVHLFSEKSENKCEP
jgi:hypothetical protein